MREIKFKGYSSGWHTWKYGDLQTPIKNNNLPFIREFDTDMWFSVEEASIGQYTGFKDKNGVEIYEGDKCKRFGKVYNIKFIKGSFIGVCNEDSSYSDHIRHLLNEIEVIGNTYEEQLVERRITVYNCRTDKILLNIEGYMSLNNNSSNELVVTCKTGVNEYKKNYVILNNWVIYVVEDITGTHTDPYHYQVIFNPDAILPTVQSSRSQ